VKKDHLKLIKQMVAHLGEEFVLTANIKEFGNEARNFVASYLDYTPDWTVKKGQ
jgi:hypothetical protein